MLFTTPVVRAIKDAYPESFIAYWCNERVEGILKNNPCINKVFALSRGDLKRIYRKSRLEGIRRFIGLLQKIRTEKFDISLDFSLDYRYSLISKILGIKRRIGFDYNKRGRFLTEKIKVQGYDSRHIVEYYLDLLRFVKIGPGSRNLELKVSEAARAKAEKIFSHFNIGTEALVIGIAPGGGASWGKDSIYKHWPAIKFAQLADKIAGEYNAKIILLGSQDDVPVAEAVIKMMKNKALDLTGATDIDELAAVIEKLKILIANDGGILHMAVALGLKTVSIFGPVSDLVYGPYPAGLLRHAVVSKEMPCRPCYKNFRFTGCSNDRRCMSDITVDDVYLAARGLI